MKMITSFTDKELLQMMREDDGQAFGELYQRYWSKLYFLAHRHLKSAMAAEEIVQDVFMILWQKRSELEIVSLPQYLAAMTRYAVYRYLAKEQKDTLQQKIFNLQTGRQVINTAIDNRLLLEMVSNLANELPEKCRLVFIHNKLNDQPLPVVAKKLNISVKTAEAHLTKALREIRLKLGGIFFTVLQFIVLFFSR